MNCQDIRVCLLESVYGEISADANASLENHLADCESCRRELEQLRRCRERLDTLPEPRAPVDLSKLYRTAESLTLRSRRRWRRAALAACAAVFVLAVLSAGRLQWEWTPGQLTVSWGRQQPSAPPARQVAAPAIEPQRAMHEERLETLEDIVRLLALELDERDKRYSAALGDLRRRWGQSNRDVARLSRQMDSRWDNAEANIRDLYLAQFGRDSQNVGAIP